MRARRSPFPATSATSTVVGSRSVAGLVAGSVLMPLTVVRRVLLGSGSPTAHPGYGSVMENSIVEVVALDDDPEVKANNPIHGAGAQAAGYERPITGGCSNYGWATTAVLELLGDGWLDRGWAEFFLRRPVYAGDRLRCTATRTDGGG